MSAEPNDTLLQSLRLIVRVVQIMIVIAAVLFIGLFAVLPFMGPGGMEDLKLGNDPGARLALMALLALGILVIGIVWQFLGNLLAIIDTVGEGDPFVPANADRLETMGWLCVWVIGIAMVMLGIGAYIAVVAPEAEVSVHFDLGLFVLALVLFILARVFRHGADMRQDLDGTV